MSRLQRDVKALTIGKKKPRDYDPEDERIEEDDDESGTGSEKEGKDSAGGREHYEHVGKSKLRKPEGVSLGSKYGAAAVSRAALNGEESDDDPFALQDDDEDEDPFADEGEDEDGEDVSSAEENDVSGVAISNDEEESAEDTDDAENEDDDLSQADGSDDEHAAPRLVNGTALDKDRAALRAQLAGTSLHLASGLSKAANDDVNKGQAVKRQNQTFDRLLDGRMKIQKGLTASEELAAQQDTASFTSDADAAIQDARDAALRLFNTIGSFRDSIAEAGASQSGPSKRKRPSHVDDADDLDSVWKCLKELEAESRPARQTTINRWSAKAKQSDPARNVKSKFLDSSSHDDRLTAVLDTFVINEQEKFFRSHHTEGQEDEESASANSLPAYDDSVFYQSLLRDLITARSAASTSDISASTLPPRLHPSGNSQNKKAIDTKASKGRKIRYTVHDKLQNFMASEGDVGRDTAMWTDRGKSEFFGSLLGQDRVLREEDEDEDMVDGEDMNGDGAEVEALRLFRT